MKVFSAGKEKESKIPIRWIKVLEDYGDIHEVGFWVMEQAIKQQVEWRDTYGELQISFNVSYQQFLDDTFEEKVISCAKKYGVNPNYIIIELTESCQVEAPKELAVTLCDGYLYYTEFVRIFYEV